MIDACSGLLHHPPAKDVVVVGPIVVAGDNSEQESKRDCPLIRSAGNTMIRIIATWS